MKISRQQTLPFTEDASTCLQADSPASRLASQAKDMARTITATYGQRCCEQFEKLSHVGLWAKTFSALLIGRAEWYSSRCNLIWKMLGTKCNRILFRLAPSMRPIAETECGLLPTVVTQGLKYCNEKGQSAFVNPQFLPTPNAAEAEKYTKKLNASSQMGMSLTARAVNGLLPTPLSTEVSHPSKNRQTQGKGGQTMGSRKNGESRPNGIQDFLMWHNLIPTCLAQDCRHALHDRGRGKLGEEIAETFGDGTSQNSQLNPLFVAEMMGFPTDWTLAPFLDGLRSTNDGDSVAGGAKCQSKPTATP